MEGSKEASKRESLHRTDLGHLLGRIIVERRGIACWPSSVGDDVGP